MDMYGIGNAISAFTETLSITSRCSGRTTLMMQNLRDGDRVIFNNRKECERIKRLACESNLSIHCIVVTDIRNPSERLLKSAGRTIFDHSWVEEFYKKSILQAQKDIVFIQNQLSDEPTPTEPTLVNPNSNSFDC